MSPDQSAKLTVKIRDETAADRPAVWNVNRLAFSADAEPNLVDALRDGAYGRVSLVALIQDQIVGHILFSRLPIITSTETIEALSLAPMAVLPEYQRSGIGSRLVQAGLEACAKSGHKIVFVLGHPQYYPRFGFSANLARPVICPFGDGDAWMAIELVAGSLANVAGRVEYPRPFSELS